MRNQIRWNCIPQEYEDPSQWTFVIFNTRERELEIRRARILTELRPTEEYQGPIDGKVNQTFYRILRFLSPVVPDERTIAKLYSGKITEDRKLGEKTDNSTLESYVQSLLR